MTKIRYGYGILFRPTLDDQFEFVGIEHFLLPLEVGDVANVVAVGGIFVRVDSVDHEETMASVTAIERDHVSRVH